MKTYQELLLDPRWQEMRLRVFDRDKWTCQECRCTKLDGRPFHVHHKRYRPLAAPWEYPMDELETLCEDCHAKTHGIARKKYIGGWHDATPEEIALADVRRAELKRSWGVLA